MFKTILSYVIAWAFYHEDFPQRKHVSWEKVFFWITMAIYSGLLYFAWFVMPALAHMEDHSGCVTVPKYHIIKLNTRPYYEGVSEDKRDYIVQFDIRGLGRPDLEYRFVLAPPAQWKNKRPNPVHWNPVGVWVDSDQRAGWDDWWIDPRGNGNCKDYIHMKWVEELGHWVLWIAHHDERQAYATN